MAYSEIVKFGTLKAVFNVVSETLNDETKTGERQFLIDTFHLFDGQNEYTLKFFPTDNDIMAIFKNAESPSELDKGLDELPDVPVRSWLECCCYIAWKKLTGSDSKC
jgi:hypothetical protein